MKKKNIYILILCLIFMLFNLGCLSESTQLSKSLNTNKINSLSTPTSIEKINDIYFIVDCWNDRVIYNDNLYESVDKWSILSNDLSGPHSIASDGNIFLVDDTDNHKIKAFKYDGKSFLLNQSIDDVGIRPHKIIYDERTKLFYSIASESQEIVALENKGETVDIVYKKKLDFLNNAYIRSINIIDNEMYFVSGPGKIIVTSYTDGNFEVIREYSLSDDLYGMNYIEKIQDYYYISIYTNNNGEIAPKFIRVKNLDDLLDNNYENLYEKMKFNGVPYYISFVDNRIFITEIHLYQGIKSFIVKNNQVIDIIDHYSQNYVSNR